MKLKSLCAALAISLCGAGASQAALVDADLPTNAYISFGGFDWAWASPVAADGSWGPDSEIDLSFQSTFGWRLPTLAELLNAPTAFDFLFAGANVPDGGFDPVSGATFFSLAPGDAACASPYFSDIFLHCDWDNGRGADGDAEDWFGTLGSQSYYDQLVVRVSVNPPPPVPVPAAGFLLIAGLGALVAMKRRKAA